MSRMQHLRINLARLRTITINRENGGPQWTADSLMAAFNLSTHQQLRRLVRSLRFVVEVRQASHADAHLGKYTRPGRVWIRGYAKIVGIRASEPTRRRVVSELMGIADARWQQETSAFALLVAEAKARAAALTDAAKGSLAGFIQVLNGA